MKKISILLLIAMLFITSISYGEGFKEESIYGLISQDGTLETLYVVNAISGLTYDYGAYNEIANLSSLEKLKIDSSKITLPNTEDLFYYQGIINNPQLPWAFDFEYTLDGKAISLKDLAGASGDLELKIKIKAGADQYKDFYNDYALQVGLKFSNDLAKNIIAKGATIVEVGGNKQVTFTVLPGQGADLQVRASIEDFQMDAITINGVKMVFDLNIDPSGLSQELQGLKVGISDLDDGAKELLGGLSRISSGLSEYTEGMGRFKSGVYQLKNGGTELSGGLNDMVQGLKTLKEQGQGLMQGVQAMETNAFLKVDQELKAMGLALPPLNKENYERVLGQDEAFIPIIIELEQALGLFQGLSGYIAGVGQLSDASQEISAGFESYIYSTSVLAESSYVLYESASELNQALLDIKAGLAAYQKGTETFKNETATIDTVLEEKVTEILGSFAGEAGQLRSFTSDENKEIASVQFFFRTENIVKEKPPIVVEKAIKTSLWQRIKNLFSW